MKKQLFLHFKELNLYLFSEKNTIDYGDEL